MDFQTILALVGGAAAAFFGSKMLVAGDTRVEDRRRRAVDLATWCRVNGLPTLSQLLTSYAVGDYSGVVHQVRALSDIISDPAQAKTTVKQFLDIQLSNQLTTTEGKEELIQLIEKKLDIAIDRSVLTAKPKIISEVPPIDAVAGPVNV